MEHAATWVRCQKLAQVQKAIRYKKKKKNPLKAVKHNNTSSVWMLGSGSTKTYIARSR